MIKIIFILILAIIFYLSIDTNKTNEHWRDMEYHGKGLTTYQSDMQSQYPISTPLDDKYSDYLNNITSPKLSLLRRILNKSQVQMNDGMKPIIFNYAERPIQRKNKNEQRIKTLANTIINLINNNGASLLKIEYISTMNETHEETDTQSKICFDMEIRIYYADSENLGKKENKYTTYIRIEYIFEKQYDILPEDQFFKQSKEKFKTYLSKLLVIGTEHMGYMAGHFGKKQKRNI